MKNLFVFIIKLKFNYKMIISDTIQTKKFKELQMREYTTNANVINKTIKIFS